jgi:hypothetical protein
VSDPAASFFERYDAFGPKRAGTSGDLDSARWLADEVARIPGLDVSLDPVRFRRFVPGAARLTSIEGSPIEGVPLFDGGLTGPEGVRGAIGPLGSDAPIGFAVMEPSMASLPGNAFARERAASRHQAIVIALTTREGGIAPLNAHDLDQPFGPPVLQVAGRDAARLSALCQAAAPVQVVVDGGREDAVSHNVRAEWSGAAPALLLLTPRTSWWTSTAERVGGIWAWHEALRALASAPGRARRVVGLATCGHELGHIGAHHAFAREPDLAVDSSLVIHLGANLGTATEPALTVRSNVEGLAARLAHGLQSAGYPAQAITAVTGGKAGGEAHEIEQRGGRYVSLIGSNPWFHAPEDRWPMSLDRDRTVAIGSAVAALAVEMAQSF